mmetsp:Transcript_30951/g.35262  ORF Transcript_30951/g.35262 Transcript_30951/m.35262 type:complete len:368 (+) Transcript_30951:183-1286(+)
MCNWVGPLLISCLGFSTTDVLCDIAIHRAPDRKKDDDVDIDAEKSVLDRDSQEYIIEEEGTFTAIQDITISTIVSIVAVLIFSAVVSMETAEEIWAGSVMTNPENSYSLMMVMLSGVFCYVSYLATLKAYETSSCTVIIPLFQVASVVVLFGTFFQKQLQGKPWIKHPKDLISYSLMLIGGLYPATGGDLKKLIKPAFWNQSFVRLAILAEVSYGIYNMLIASAESDEDIDDETLTMRFMIFRHSETFLLSRLVFILSYFAMFASSVNFRTEVYKLRTAPRRSIIASVLSELSVQTAYFCSTFAYQCYYQISVVNAAETALNNLFTLAIAYVLKKFFNLGRVDSLRNIPVKITAFVIITFGLLMATD